MAEWISVKDELPLAYVILVVAFAVCCYLAGKGNLLELVPKMLLERLEETENTGEWYENPYTDSFVCSKCGMPAPVDCIKERFYKSDFCPNCGADMRGETK